MIYGAYDDRNDARINVKSWLSQNDPKQYSPEAIRKIVKETVLRDKDPVDPIAVSWREGTYGAWLGLLEFAKEEAAGKCDLDQRGGKEQISLAVLRDRNAVQDQLSQIRSQINDAEDPLRAQMALKIAEELLAPAK